MSAPLFTLVEWVARLSRVGPLLSPMGSPSTAVSLLLAALGGGAVGATFHGSDLSGWVPSSLAVGGWLLLVFSFRTRVGSSRAEWLQVLLTNCSFGVAFRPSRLPRWTLSDGMFPQARRYVASQRLTPVEEECFLVLVDEWDGSIGELVALCRSVLPVSS